MEQVKELDPILVSEALDLKHFLELHGRTNLLSKIVFFPHGKPYLYPEGPQIFLENGNAELVEDVKFGQVANVTIGFINNRI